MQRSGGSLKQDPGASFASRSLKSAKFPNKNEAIMAKRLILFACVIKVLIVLCGCAGTVKYPS